MKKILIVLLLTATTINNTIGQIPDSSSIKKEILKTFDTTDGKKVKAYEVKNILLSLDKTKVTRLEFYGGVLVIGGLLTFIALKK